MLKRTKNPYLSIGIGIVIVFLVVSAPAVKAQAQPDQRFGESFVGVVNSHLESYHIPGAVVVVVKDGTLIYQRGFGYANRESSRPVDPSSTVFPIGSVTKLFTATAAMQLVEDGKLDLHTDINRYLKSIQVKTPYEKPITLAHLLTHTAGFDESIKDLETDTPIPLAQFLGANIPAVIREPGTVIQYSNHGMGLVGLIIEDVTGIPYEKYVVEKVLQPLEMGKSGFYLGTNLPELATGYRFFRDQYREQSVVPANLAPAASLTTTGADMAQFMIAHLEGGRLAGKRILSDESMTAMHSQQFSIHPDVLGYGFGFAQGLRNGATTYEHGGFIPPFDSMVSLAPETGIGVFVATSATSKGKVCQEIIDEVYRRLTPVTTQPTATDIQVQSSVQKLPTGEYLGVRYTHRTMPKILTLLAPDTVKIQAAGDGQLVIAANGVINNLQPLEEGLFRIVNGGTMLALTQAGDLAIGTKYYERLRWYESRKLHLALAGVCLGVFILGLCLTTVSGLCSRLKKVKPLLTTATIRRLIWQICLSHLLFTIGILLFADYSKLLALRVVLLLPFGAIFFTVKLLQAITKQGVMWVNWANGAIVALSSVIFLSLVHYYNLLGFKF